MLTSRVKIDDESPKRTPLATLIASSASFDRDQRRRRAEDLLLRDAHPRLDVAEDRRPVEEAASSPLPVATSPPVRSFAPSSWPISVYEWIFSSARLVDHRADVGVVLPARAEAQLLGGGDELRLELAVDLLVDDHAARGRAALP